MTPISIADLTYVTGGAGLGNTLRAGAIAGMGLVTGEQAPDIGPKDMAPATSGISQMGSGGRAPFQPLQLPGGGTATFGQ